jgi:hypothetical protein
VQTPRPEVRNCCAEALAAAILDKHSDHVPAGVLSDILGEILAPVVTHIGGGCLQEVQSAVSAEEMQRFTEAVREKEKANREKNAAAEESSSEEANSWVKIDAVSKETKEMGGKASLFVPTLHQFRSGSPDDMSLSDGGESSPEPLYSSSGRGSEVFAGVVCLDALCRSFLQHVHKLALYPAFDKIWLVSNGLLCDRWMDRQKIWCRCCVF